MSATSNVFPLSFTTVWFYICVLKVIPFFPLFVWPSLVLCWTSIVSISSSVLCEVFAWSFWCWFSSTRVASSWLVVDGHLLSFSFRKCSFWCSCGSSLVEIHPHLWFCVFLYLVGLYEMNMIAVYPLSSAFFVVLCNFAPYVSTLTGFVSSR